MHGPWRGFFANYLNSLPAAITVVEPSSARQYNRPSASSGEAPYVPPSRSFQHFVAFCRGDYPSRTGSSGHRQRRRRVLQRSSAGKCGTAGPEGIRCLPSRPLLLAYGSCPRIPLIRHLLVVDWGPSAEIKSPISSHLMSLRQSGGERCDCNLESKSGKSGNFHPIGVSGSSRTFRRGWDHALRPPERQRRLVGPHGRTFEPGQRRPGGDAGRGERRRAQNAAPIGVAFRTGQGAVCRGDLPDHANRRIHGGRLGDRGVSHHLCGRKGRKSRSDRRRRHHGLAKRPLGQVLDGHAAGGQTCGVELPGAFH